MKYIVQVVASVVLLFAISPPALASTPRGQTATAISASTNYVDRGGVIDSIDLTKQRVVVDGVSYEYLSNSVKINPPAGKVKYDVNEFKKGMMVRFTTVMNFSSGRDEVREIWVIGDGANSATGL